MSAAPAPQINGSRKPKPTGPNPGSGFTSFPSPSHSPYTNTTSPRAMHAPSPRNVSGNSASSNGGPGNQHQFRPNNPFARPRYSPQAHSAPLPAAAHGGSTAPLSVNGRRRAPDLDTPSTPTAARKPLPPAQSPEVSGLPRLSSLAASPRPMPTPQLSPSPALPQPQRQATRQPSTPSLTTHSIPRKPVTDPIPARTRTRSQSVFNPPTLVSTPTATDRVPPHIRLRLPLIQQLGVVLDLEPSAVAAKIDIPGLLARVDSLYARGHGSTTEDSPAGGSPMEMGAYTRSYSGEGRDGHKDNKNGGRVFGVFKRMGGGGKPKASAEEAAPFFLRAEESTGPAFAVPLKEMPGNAWCTSLIGGQKHDLPLVVFSVVEEIYRRGMSHPGIFRLAGDGTRISHLTKVFNMPPLYGDSLSISSEPIHNLTGLVKRYIRDLPEPILDESLFSAFVDFCLDRDQDFPAVDKEALVNTKTESSSPGTGTATRPLEVRIAAAQIMLRLLPPLHFSLFIYLLAFLGQLPLFPDNRLNLESISIIFGPAMIAARGQGIPGLGPSSANVKNREGAEPGSDAISEMVNHSQAILSWLLRHWSMISEKVLDNFDTPAPAPSLEEKGGLEYAQTPEPLSKAETVLTPTANLLAPVDIKASQPETPFHYAPPPAHAASPPAHVPIVRSAQNTADRSLPAGSANSSSTGFSETPTATHPPSRPVSPAGSVSGIFARAFGARPANHQEEQAPKKPKRSASFTSISSISSLMKKGGGGWMGKGEHKGPNLEAARSLSAEKLTVREPAPGPGIVNPQISNVLGSLHDLLVSKDKQIERDAREMALLRHTILELDEKLSKSRGSCSCAAHPSSTGPNGAASGGATEKEQVLTPTPAITITPTPSTIPLVTATQQEVIELQTQLTTALAAAETTRLGSRALEKRILELEARLSRAGSERGLEVGKLQMALAMEQGKVVALSEERDEARERLEKIKTTLFAVT